MPRPIRVSSGTARCQLVREGEPPVASIAHDVELSLRRWIKQAELDSARRWHVLTTGEREEELRRRRPQERRAPAGEREVLRKRPPAPSAVRSGKRTG